MKTFAVAAAAVLLFTGTAQAEHAHVAHASGKFEKYSETS
jgi:hypothetical protein